ncbi:hypothetical protein L9G74_07715 [Shewanella sp. C32]|uniref:Uncharacterized protein n=1 Tax=Shewanella electrica TaxID=515560 RepID=A0ABT2FJ02_9GAMM|nr:hypothetical protein [Shewanella electrica]MCH1924418.1 hypothetical protein [Shewanella electrica]MCS4556319.1 hypothetical protein [Shewanella electrica]
MTGAQARDRHQAVHEFYAAAIPRSSSIRYTQISSKKYTYYFNLMLYSYGLFEGNMPPT